MIKDLLVPIVEKHGITAAIAVVLIWWLTAVLQADLASIKVSTEQVRREHMEMRFYLQGICLNAASSEVEERRCIYASDHR